MSDAVVEVTTFQFSPDKAPKQTWVTKGEVIKFDGFMKLYIEGTDDEASDEEDNSTLPSISL